MFTVTSSSSPDANDGSGEMLHRVILAALGLWLRVSRSIMYSKHYQHGTKKMRTCWLFFCKTRAEMYSRPIESRTIRDPYSCSGGCGSWHEAAHTHAKDSEGKKKPRIVYPRVQDILLGGACRNRTKPSTAGLWRKERMDAYCGHAGTLYDPFMDHVSVPRVLGYPAHAWPRSRTNHT
jgi:hypothetical protein